MSVRGNVPYDLPGVHVACVEDKGAPTGLTLLRFVDGAACAVDIRGGAVAARELATVSLDDGWGEIDGLLFVGGSTWGLDAAAGVIDRLTDRRGETDFDDIPAVPTAAVYDFTGRKGDRIPDADMARAAFDRLAHGEVPIGRVGAGANVTVGTLFGDEHGTRSGQGAAFGTFEGARVLVVAIVNAAGNVYDKAGRRIGGGIDPFVGLRARGEGRGSNTLLLAVVTDVALDRLGLRRVAVMTNAAAGRLIDPFHTPEDGDVCFACSLGQRRTHADSALEVGVLAGRLVQDAILAALAAAA